MDPLSATASIIACLQAANAVISVCLDYRSALNNAPWGLAKAIEEARDLRNVLESLESLAERLEGQSSESSVDDKRSWASLQLLCSADKGPLERCIIELNHLEKMLCAPKWSQNLGQKRRALIQAVGWRIKDSDVRDSLKNIERYKATINLALNADQAWVFVQ